MRRRPPEEQAPRQGLHILQDGGAGGGEALHALAPGVGQGERTAPEGVWKHAEQEGQQPRQEDDHVPVLQGNPLRPPHEDEREDAYSESQRKTDQERREGAVAAVQEGNAHRQQHEQRTHQERYSDISRYDFQVHSDPPSEAGFPSAV